MTPASRLRGGMAKGESQISTCMMFVRCTGFVHQLYHNMTKLISRWCQAVPYSAHIRTILHYHLFD